MSVVEKEIGRNSRELKCQLIVDRAVNVNRKTRCTNQIGYKKAYDLKPHTWVLECLNCGTPGSAKCVLMFGIQC